MKQILLTLTTLCFIAANAFAMDKTDQIIYASIVNSKNAGSLIEGCLNAAENYTTRLNNTAHGLYDEAQLKSIHQTQLLKCEYAGYSYDKLSDLKVITESDLPHSSSTVGTDIQNNNTNIY